MPFKISWEPEIKPANTVNSCVLCSEDYKGFGHNPWPLNKGRGRCCDNCNGYVLLARIANMKAKKKPAEEMLVDDRTYKKIKSLLDMEV